MARMVSLRRVLYKGKEMGKPAEYRLASWGKEMVNMDHVKRIVPVRRCMEGSEGDERECVELHLVGDKDPLVYDVTVEELGGHPAWSR